MALNGNNVIVKSPIPNRPKGIDTSDLVINGKAGDVYTPKHGVDVDGVYRYTKEKRRQVEGDGTVVIDLTETNSLKKSDLDGLKDRLEGTEKYKDMQIEVIDKPDKK